MKMKVLTVLAVLFVIAPIQAEEWPCWRGPRLDGTSLEKDVPVHWSSSKNIAWKSPVSGIGHSSPIIWGDRVFLTSCILKKKQRILLCYDRRSGKLLWNRVVVEAPLESKHRLNSFASSTPATDGKHVFVTFLAYPNVQIVCYDFQGNKVWHKSPGTFYSKHGFCSSPILYKDKVIVNCDQDAKGKTKGYIVALNKETGEEMYRIDRPNRTRSYCAPLIVDAAGKKQMVLSGSKCVTSYDPDTGKLHWIIDGPTQQYVASLVYTEGVFFLTAGFPTYHNMGILPDGTGNVTTSHVLWHEDRTSARKASYVPSPIAHGKYFYMISDKGYLSCFEAKTGKRMYIQQLGEHHSGSPVSADDLLYIIDDAGDTYVIKPGPEFQFVTKNSLDENCYSSPAISRGQFFIRTQHHLWCIGTARESAKANATSN